jgi:hypothetical protein
MFELQEDYSFQQRYFFVRWKGNTMIEIFRTSRASGFRLMMIEIHNE